jgi:hypothetical protein
MLSAVTWIELRSPLKGPGAEQPRKAIPVGVRHCKRRSRLSSQPTYRLRVLQQRYNKLFEATAVLATGNDSVWHGARPQQSFRSVGIGWRREEGRRGHSVWIRFYSKLHGALSDMRRTELGKRTGFAGDRRSDKAVYPH